MVDLEALGYLIRDAREAKRITQRALGQRLGLSAASISLLETGKTKNLKLPLLEQLADILEIPKPKLLEVAGVSLPDGEERTLQWLAEEMDAPNRRRLIAIGHALLQEQKSQPQRANR